MTGAPDFGILDILDRIRQKDRKGESSLKLLVIGSVNRDTVFEVEHIVHPGETLSVLDRKSAPGGKGLNQALSACRAGVETWFAGCIGPDGADLRGLLERSGVHTAYLQTVAEATGQALIQVDRRGENCILVCDGANASVTLPMASRVLDHFGAGDLLLLQNEIRDVPQILQEAQRRGLRVILNPSPFSPALRSVDLQSLYGIILNETEAAAWADSDNPEDFLRLAERCPELHLVLTLGARGGLYRHRGQALRYPSYRVPVVDTTGAGDTFAGYFLAGLCRGEEPEALLRTASLASALAISQKGAASSIPERAAVEAARGTIPENA